MNRIMLNKNLKVLFKLFFYLLSNLSSIVDNFIRKKAIFALRTIFDNDYLEPIRPSLLQKQLREESILKLFFHKTKSSFGKELN